MTIEAANGPDNNCVCSASGILSLSVCLCICLFVCLRPLLSALSASSCLPLRPLPVFLHRPTPSSLSTTASFCPLASPRLV
ncbi:hypothetical protein E2C01_068123 [Portunus trituberculatus]|uniref:Uncharacterized protein n=1 Tax=Portunus trituberculatus TaxID=210409 RepID=A0A5B7HVP5_PORTR|nr:hypothetical protein [Portunus trituberculatus]